MKDELKNRIKEYGKEDVDYESYIKDHLLKDDDKLIYLVITGSNLYGTDNEESDLDIKGIFFPSIKSLITGSRRDRYSVSTGEDTGTNSREDVDIDLYSLHEFLRLIKKGDTNAYEMLYAYGYKEAVLLKSTYIADMYMQSHSLISKQAIKNGFIGYAYGQFKKYHNKKHRFEVLKLIEKFFKEYNEYETMSDYCFTRLLKYLENNTDTENIDEVIEYDDGMYKINGRIFYPNTPVREFINSIEAQLSKYGSRVKQGSIDYKSIYHALRVCYMANDLATEGHIKLPFSEITTNFLVEVKNGVVDEDILLKHLDKIVKETEEAVEKSDNIPTNIDEEFVDDLIYEYYDWRLRW